MAASNRLNQIWISCTLALLCFVASPANAQQYCDDSGLIVAEFENLPIANNSGTYFYEYKDGTGSDPEVDFGGFTGDLYMTYNGPTGLHQFSQPGIGVMTLEIDVEEAGEYLCKIRNRHPSGAVSGENNDIWMRVNGSGWQKIYSYTYNQWNWVTREDHHTGGHTDCFWDLNAGYNIIEFSGRSDKFSIDRFHIGKNVGSRITDSSEIETLCPEPPNSEPGNGEGNNEEPQDDSSSESSDEPSELNATQLSQDESSFDVGSGCGSAQTGGSSLLLLLLSIGMILFRTRRCAQRS